MSTTIRSAGGGVAADIGVLARRGLEGRLQAWALKFGYPALTGFRAAPFIFIAAFLAVAAPVMIRPSRWLIDTDTYWHIVVGKHIWTTLQLPRYDEFSHTMAGAPWIAKEWLSQLILSGAFFVAGWSGVVYLSIAIVAFSFVLILKFLLQDLKPTIAVALVAIFAASTSPHLLARPHIFVFPLVVFWTKALLERADRQEPPSAWFLGIVALWANLHASAPIAPVLAATIAVPALIRCRREERVFLTQRWGLFIVAAAVATCVTPYGPAPLLVAFKLIGTQSVGRVSEWRPMGVDPPSLLALLALGGSIALVVPPWRNLLRALPIAFCGYLMVRHVRFVDLFALVTPLVIAKPLADRFRSFAARTFVTNEKARRWAVGAAAALLFLDLSFASFARPRPPAESFPESALAAARTAQVSGNVFNDYWFGGFLIFEGVKTFIDSRVELFGGGLLEEQAETLDRNEADAFFALLEKHRVGWALVQPASNSAQLLSHRPSWRRIYADENAIVYVKVYQE